MNQVTSHLARGGRSEQVYKTDGFYRKVGGAGARKLLAKEKVISLSQESYYAGFLCSTDQEIPGSLA